MPPPNVSFIPTSSRNSEPAVGYRFTPCPDCGKLISKWTKICPDCGYHVALPMREKKYPALHIVAVILKIIAVLTFAVDLVLIAYVIAKGEEVGKAGITIPLIIQMILAPIFTWALAELILLLIDIEDNTSRLSADAAEERKFKEEYRVSKITSLEPEEAVRARLELAKAKISPDLYSTFQKTDQSVAVRVDMKNPIKLETFARRFEYLGFELVDDRPGRERTIGHKTKTITGFIEVEYLADLALAPNVEKVSSWHVKTD